MNLYPPNLKNYLPRAIAAGLIFLAAAVFHTCQPQKSLGSPETPDPTPATGGDTRKG